MTRQTADFNHPRPQPYTWVDFVMIGTVSVIGILALTFLLLVGLLVKPAGAMWKPEYAQASQEVRDWYANAEVTEPALKRLGFRKCCDKTEVVKSRFKVDSATGSDEWFYEKDGKWVRIPPDIIHWGEHAPDGMPTLFALAFTIGEIPVGTLTCFYPPESGI